MAVFEFLQLNPLFLYISVLILGLTVGSFLNVVINRLPVMLKREWKQQCDELVGKEPEQQLTRFNLLVPASTCPGCGHKIRFYENIPVLSFLLLKGRCSSCKNSISFQYPLVEIISGILSVCVIAHFGITLTALAALGLSWALIALCVIDLKHMLLPDDITLPILWLGVLLSLENTFVSPAQSILGAVCGYLAFWSVYHLFKLLTHKEGMGYGDFKLLAMLGAWFGWQSLPLIIFLSSLIGAIVGLSLIVFAKHNQQIPIPFGPYLATAGWATLIWGNEMNTFLYQWMGLTH